MHLVGMYWNPKLSQSRSAGLTGLWITGNGLSILSAKRLPLYDGSPFLCFDEGAANAEAAAADDDDKGLVKDLSKEADMVDKC